MVANVREESVRESSTIYIWEDEESRLLSWGSLLLCSRVLARHFGVMHTGTKGGATITNGQMYTPRELRVFKKRLDKPIVNP